MLIQWNVYNDHNVDLYFNIFNSKLTFGGSKCVVILSYWFRQNIQREALPYLCHVTKFVKVTFKILRIVLYLYFLYHSCLYFTIAVCIILSWVMLD